MATKEQKRRVSRTWTKDDVKSLRGFAKDRLSGSQAAKKLRRTSNARRRRSEGDDVGHQVPVHKPQTAKSRLVKISVVGVELRSHVLSKCQSTHQK